MRTGERPVLMTCAPMPQITPALGFASRAQRPDDSLEISAGENVGQAVDEGRNGTAC